MGHDAESTVVYVGLARLPQPLVAPVPSVAVELEVDPRTGRVVAANTNLQFPALERLLREILVGKPVDNGVGHALLELEVRYSAPFDTALRVAVQRALDGAKNREGTVPQRVALSSA